MCLALHVAPTVLDTFVSVPVAAAFVPFVSSYQTFWLGLGAVALDLLLTLVATSLLRNRLGQRVWRRVHWLATPAGPSAWRTAWASAQTGPPPGCSR